MKLVSLHHVSVSYDKVPVLTDVDLDIRNDDFIGVIGPNGGGKTTLVKAILKAVPYSGEVIYAPEIENRGCRRIGYLPQISEIDKSFPISVREVVLSGLQARKRLLGRYTAEDRQKADELLHTCRIEEIARKPIGTLSGGQIQRTLLCRALISDPELLILDEPTAGVDIELRRSMWGFLKDLNDKGTTIILTTHYLEEAEMLCRNIGIIQHGELVENTSMKALLAKLKSETFILDLAPKSPLPKLDGYQYRLVDTATLEVEVLREQGINSVFTQLSEQGIQVLSMRNKANRLEELFVSLVNEKQGDRA